ncbi:hypothetical protein L596_027887 [Steinernema carpocapsae]|uniref:Uncharacterized protein n=1 Tax=Steinernema carpocapsae TaxID=34508 RepID=A0A4V5ZXR0_STECR|nr:hypothetical protein L596_027887 [Steinernema carpocapsae]
MHKTLLSDGLVNTRDFAIDLDDRRLYYADWNRERPIRTDGSGRLEQRGLHRGRHPASQRNRGRPLAPRALLARRGHQTPLLHRHRRSQPSHRLRLSRAPLRTHRPQRAALLLDRLEGVTSVSTRSPSTVRAIPPSPPASEPRPTSSVSPLLTNSATDRRRPARTTTEAARRCAFPEGPR